MISEITLITVKRSYNFSWKKYQLNQFSLKPECRSLYSTINETTELFFRNDLSMHVKDFTMKNKSKTKCIC